MNKKYGDGTTFVTQTYLPEKDNWKPSDFRLKKVVFENKDKYYDSILNGKDYPVFDKSDIYFFSEPIL